MSKFCEVREPEELQILREIASFLHGHSLRDQRHLNEKIKEVAKQRWETAQTKLAQFKADLRTREEHLFSQVSSLDGTSIQDSAKTIIDDKKRQKLKDEITSLEIEPKTVTPSDTEDLIKEYKQKGFLSVEEGKLKITSKGAQLLGHGFLQKIMENLSKTGVGTHRVEQIGYGTSFSTLSRPYRYGDTYDRIDIEKTFLNILEKGKGMNEFDVGDIEILELLSQTKLNIGIIVDESGSMTYGRGYKKIEAAIETALAIAELMRTKYPNDKLKVFTFSEVVKEVSPWDVVNIQVPMYCTDIKAGLRAYRISTRHERGNKQVYLITDTEPNFEEGKRIGFQKAAQGVLDEARRYRTENITLNIIMLDRTQQLKKFATQLAKQNLGRVFFTSPENLGEVILEDYISSKKERLLSR